MILSQLAHGAPANLMLHYNLQISAKEQLAAPASLIALAAAAVVVVEIGQQRRRNAHLMFAQLERATQLTYSPLIDSPPPPPPLGPGDRQATGRLGRSRGRESCNFRLDSGPLTGGRVSRVRTSNSFRAL